MNMSGLLIYGVPFAMVGAVILFVVKRYIQVSSEQGLVFTAAWTTAGFLLSTYLKPLEQLWPGMPTHLPVIMNAILLFGATMGFKPGATTNKLVAKVARPIGFCTGFLKGIWRAFFGWKESECCEKDDTFYRRP